MNPLSADFRATCLIRRVASLALVSAALALAACSGSESGPRRGSVGDDDDAGSTTLPDAGLIRAQDAGDIVIPTGELSIEPQDPVLALSNGKSKQLAFHVKRNGVEVAARWSISRAELGAIDSRSGVFKSSRVGGKAEITADVKGDQVSTSITVMAVLEQNGGTAADSCAAGGCDGVGGEGAGPAVSAKQKTALDGKPSKSTTLRWLYPYDATVWPLGLLAPLLQWEVTEAAVADAVKLELSGEYFSYEGYFARPAALAAGAPLVRHPIPQAAWEDATRSAVRGQLHAKLTLLIGGKAYGPIEQTWTIAGGALKGTVYYQSYGTNLAKNHDGAMGGDGRFGGATLSITGSSTQPSLVAGGDGDDTSCRVCHTVSADGSRMVVQHGDDYTASSSYALTQAGFPETLYPIDGLMGWVGLYPDGSIGLGNGAPLSGNANTGPSTLLDATTGMTISSSGLSSFVTEAGMPTFSPDGSKVAFNFTSGPGDAKSGPGATSKLVVMSFNLGTKTFSKPKLVHEGIGGELPGWPAFMPDGDRLVFQMDLPSGGNKNELFSTRRGKRGELWWIDLASGDAHPLERANGSDGGKVYLPVLPNNHDHDEELAYEPTVSPIASGGYAWVVFTSRRAYGNVASIDPTFSDPRDHDLTQTPTPKKLWVAAIDLAPTDPEAQPNVDPSHPAFYLPAQELLAGNGRGYWVPEPCRADAKACQSGDQCCGGYCAFDAKLKKNVCGGKPPECAKEFDRCKTTSDCCDANDVCIGGYCSVVNPE